MKIYNFRCKNCGSNKYKKIDDKTYKCVYCDTIEEIFSQQKNIVDKPNKSEVNQETKVQEDIEISRVPHAEEKSSEQTSEVKEKNKILNSALFKLIICFFFGGLGIHKFLEGKTIWGIIYLCSAGLFYVGWAFDVVINLGRLINELLKHKGE